MKKKESTMQFVILRVESWLCTSLLLHKLLYQECHYPQKRTLW